MNEGLNEDKQKAILECNVDTDTDNNSLLLEVCIPVHYVHDPLRYTYLGSNTLRIRASISVKGDYYIFGRYFGLQFSSACLAKNSCALSGIDFLNSKVHFELLPEVMPEPCTKVKIMNMPNVPASCVKVRRLVAICFNNSFIVCF